MSVISTSNHPKSLWPGINAIWGIAYNEKTQQWTRMFTKETSDKKYEEDFESTSFGLAPEKPEGTAILYDTHSQLSTTRYTNVTYGLGWIVTAEELSDNQYAKLAAFRTRALAYSFRQTKETVGANILNRAFNSGFVGGDGKELVATDHPTQGGTQSNELSPAADLSEASLETMMTQVRNFRNSRGLKIEAKPQMLVVAPANQFEAFRLVNSNLRPGTANNDTNALREMGMLPDGVFVYDYLTDDDAWFITTDIPDGLKMFQRWPYKFTKDNDFDTDNAKAKATERYVFGWSDWRSIVGSPGA